MTPAQYITAAFMSARGERPELDKEWVGASFRVGSRLPRSTLMVSAQRAGELDLILRSMEAAFRPNTPPDQGLFQFHYQTMLSELWIGRVSAVFETTNRIRRRPSTAGWDDAARDVNAVRVAIEKHQIAHDEGRSVDLVPYPPRANEVPETYNGNDARRAFIPPMGVSERGSVVWGTLDIRKQQPRWIERQELSDRVLRLWSEPAEVGTRQGLD